MGYCTISDVLARIGTDERTVQISSLIDAASVEIDRWCGRSFTAPADEASARVYRPDPCAARLWIDDVADSTDFALKTDDNGDGTYEKTWSAADYLLEPPNQILDGITAHPYVAVVSLLRPWPAVWSRPECVQITARWGWSAIPNAVKTTAVELVARALLTPVGVRSETIGSYSVTYDPTSGAAGGLTLASSDMDRLSGYQKTWQ